MTRFTIRLAIAVLVIVLIPGSATVLAQEGSTDRDVLVALYNATDGPNWKNNDKWLSDAPIGEWYGVTTDGNGRVTGLRLSENQLGGSIPAELGNLSKLTVLSLSYNELSGEIPQELGNLLNLEWLELNYNQLSGEIPRELHSLTSQPQMYMECNRFSRGILPTPDELYELFEQMREQVWVEAGWSTDKIGLGKLYLATCGQNWKNNDKWLSEAPIGEWYGVTTDDSGSVTELSLTGNGLNGTIPVELESLADLQGLYLSGNSLTDCIPRGLSNIQSNDLPEIGLPFCGAATPTLAPTPIPVLATEIPMLVPTRTPAPTPIPTPAIERGFFFNSNLVRSPEAEMPFNLLDPVTLSLIGIILTLIATSIQLFKGR